MKILLLEDDAILQEIIEEYLVEQGHEVVCFEDGEVALDAIGSDRYDMLLLDVNVPSVDGFELLAYLREIGNTTPALYITSLHSVEDLKRGFEIGADDYLKKPFELEELGARIAHIERVRQIEEEVRIGDLRFEVKAHLLHTPEGVVQMRQKEAQILAYFLKERGRIVSADELIENVWSDEEPPAYETIRTYIKNLRRLLGERYIETVKGEGYRFNIV